MIVDSLAHIVAVLLQIQPVHIVLLLMEICGVVTAVPTQTKTDGKEWRILTNCNWWIIVHCTCI